MPGCGEDGGLMLPARIIAKIDFNGPVPAHAPHLGPCHLWTAACKPSGYGQLWLGGTQRRAHKAIYEVEVGPVPAGLVLDHLCRVRRCVNSTHQEPVSNAVNVQRGDAGKMRGAIMAAKTHCPHGHAYDEVNTLVEHSSGGKTRRHCRACARARDAARRSL